MVRSSRIPNPLRTPTIEAQIDREEASDLESEMPDRSRDGAVFRVRAYPTGIAGLDGSLLVFERVLGEGRSTGQRTVGPGTPISPPGQTPLFPNYPPASLVCRGIFPGTGAELYSHESHTARIDVRRKLPQVTLSREGSAILDRWGRSYTIGGWNCLIVISVRQVWPLDLMAGSTSSDSCRSLLLKTSG